MEYQVQLVASKALMAYLLCVDYIKIEAQCKYRLQMLSKMFSLNSLSSSVRLEQWSGHSKEENRHDYFCNRGLVHWLIVSKRSVSCKYSTFIVVIQKFKKKVGMESSYKPRKKESVEEICLAFSNQEQTPWGLSKLNAESHTVKGHTTRSSKFLGRKVPVTYFKHFYTNTYDIT